MILHGIIDNERSRRTKMCEDWNFWLSLITIGLSVISVIVAVIAVTQTKNKSS